MTTREQILQQALALPPEDRAFVADGLEQSLSPSDFATPEIAAAWAAEIDARIAAYDRGEVAGMDADQSLESIRQQLAAFQARQPKS